LCAGSTECLGLAVRQGRLARALRASLEPAALDGLRVHLSGCARMEGRSQSEMEGT